MNTLTVAIPCYNSAAYMRTAVESALHEDVEIIIVNDGSTDNTGQIADSLAARYPDRVKVIHQENKGHGGAVNAGIRNASGQFFKVLDSDDRFDKAALNKVIKVLNRLIYEDRKPDALFANYVYDKVGEKNRPIRYKNAMPVDRLFTWEETKKFRQGQYLLMHSIIYRTALLRKCKLQLLEHTFYVDNLYAYLPLPYVKNMYYMNENLYYYFIGRDDQSVNEENMMKRIDQQLKVTHELIDKCDVLKVKDEHCKRYMLSYLYIMMTVSSIYLIKIGTEESIEKRDALWSYVERKDKKLYKYLKSGIIAHAMRSKTGVGRTVAKCGYQVSKAIFKFG